MAYFRWKNVADDPTHFAMQLWIDHPKIPGPTAAKGQPAGQPVDMPNAATASVTLRRLQQSRCSPARPTREKYPATATSSPPVTPGPTNQTS